MHKAISATFATLWISLALVAACDGQSARDTATEIVPLRPSDATDASSRPPPDLNALQKRSSPQDASSPQTHDAYQAAQGAYKAALDKAKIEHQSEIANCNALEKAAQKNCKEYADSRLKLAKAEAEKLKPAS